MLNDENTIALKGWGDFFERKTTAVEDSMLRFSGGTVHGSETKVAQLEVDDLVHRKEIERAVSDFITSEVWPKLTFVQYRILLLRFFTARDLVRRLIETDGATENRQAPPNDLSDRSHVIRWALVDVWNDMSKDSARKKIASFLSAQSTV